MHFHSPLLFLYLIKINVVRPIAINRNSSRQPTVPAIKLSVVPIEVGVLFFSVEKCELYLYWIIIMMGFLWLLPIHLMLLGSIFHFRDELQLMTAGPSKRSPFLHSNITIHFSVSINNVFIDPLTIAGKLQLFISPSDVFLHTSLLGFGIHSPPSMHVVVRLLFGKAPYLQ